MARSYLRDPEDEEDERARLQRLLVSLEARRPDMEIGLEESGQSGDMPALNPYYDRPRKPDMQFDAPTGGAAALDMDLSNDPEALAQSTTDDDRKWDAFQRDTERYMADDYPRELAARQQSGMAPPPAYDRTPPSAAEVEAPPAAPMRRPSDDEPSERDTLRKLLNMVPDVQTALAMGIDLAANRGRGVGQIASTFTANRMALDREEREGKRQLEIARARKESDPMTAFLAQQRIDIARQNAGTSQKRQLTNEERAALAQTRYTDAADPNSAINTTKTLLREQGARASTKGRLDETHARTDEIGGDRAQIAGRVREAQLQTEHEMAPLRAADAAAQAGGVKRETARASIDTPDADEERKRRTETARHEPPPGWRSTPKWEANTADDAGANKNKTFMRESAAGLRSLDRMIELRKKYGPEIMKSVAGGEMDALQNIAVGQLSTAANTASVNGGEWERYAKRIPSLAIQGTDAADTLSYAATGKKRDSALNELIGARNALQLQQDTNAAQLGLERDSDSLGTAKVPAKPNMGGGGEAREYKLQSPTGRTGTLKLTDFELDKFKRKGWTVL